MKTVQYQEHRKIQRKLYKFTNLKSDLKLVWAFDENDFKSKVHNSKILKEMFG